MVRSGLRFSGFWKIKCEYNFLFFIHCEKCILMAFVIKYLPKPDLRSY